MPKLPPQKEQLQGLQGVRPVALLSTALTRVPGEEQRRTERTRCSLCREESTAELRWGSTPSSARPLSA